MNNEISQLRRLLAYDQRQARSLKAISPEAAKDYEDSAKNIAAQIAQMEKASKTRLTSMINR